MPPPAEAPHATRLLVLLAGVSAASVTPLPVMMDPDPISALLVALTTLTDTPAPILTSLSIPNDAPIALAEESSSNELLTDNALVVAVSL